MMWRFDKFTDNLAAIDDKGNCITYGQLEKLSNEFNSICTRKLCFNICQNSIGSMAGYAAMINSGVVPVMVAEDMDKELLNDLLEKYKPQYIWIPDDRKEEYSDYEDILCDFGYTLKRTLFDENIDLYDELALLLTTSGSTGSPKLVRQSYRNILTNTESIVEYLKLDSSERPITTLPMNYTYGISIINSHLYVGATILITDKTLMQKEFWTFLRDNNATSFGGVPYTYEMLKKLRFFRMPNDSIRTMTQAGGKLTPELHKEFAEYAKSTGKNFIVMYGQTEATARMAYLPADKSLEKFGSMGIAIPGGTFSLIDVNGQEISETETVGELVYFGANVTLGYATIREDLAKGDERNGRLETGDMAKRDKDGFYYIVGRKKRFLKIYGKRVNLDEIDTLVKEGFDGIDCASAGTDDNMYVFITNSALIDDVRKYVIDKTHLSISAIKVQYIESIPRNDAGKIRYTEFEKYYK